MFKSHCVGVCALVARLDVTARPRTHALCPAPGQLPHACHALHTECKLWQVSEAGPPAALLGSGLETALASAQGRPALA